MKWPKKVPGLTLKEKITYQRGGVRRSTIKEEVERLLDEQAQRMVEDAKDTETE